MIKIITLLITAILIIPTTKAQNVAIGTGITTNKLEVLSIVNSGSLATVLGTNTGNTGTAIAGNSSNTNAPFTISVVGTSNNGIGVQGYTNNHIGVSCVSLGGNALTASSASGYALQVIGNLKIAGGNTSPAAGSVLTSDFIGNATWKKSRVAFMCQGTLQALVPSGVFQKVEFIDEAYDLENNFAVYNGGVTASSSVFTAPVAGVYHFSSALAFLTTSYTNAQIRLIKNTSSNAIANQINKSFDNNAVDLQITGDFHLDANDKIWVAATQSSGVGAPISHFTYRTRFSGHLVKAD